MNIISPEDFQNKVLSRIPAEYRKSAKKLFTDYGEYLSENVVEALCIGLDKKNWTEVFNEMEQFYEKHVKSDDPDMRYMKKLILYYEDIFFMIFARLSGNESMI